MLWAGRGQKRPKKTKMGQQKSAATSNRKVVAVLAQNSDYFMPKFLTLKFVFQGHSVVAQGVLSNLRMAK